MKQTYLRKGLDDKTYKQDLAIRKGYESYTDYKKRKVEERKQKKPKYIVLSDIVNHILKEREITETEFAREIDVTRQSVSLYVNAESYPKHDVLMKILNYAKIPFEDYMQRLRDYASR